jgi:hypothetical protein
VEFWMRRDVAIPKRLRDLSKNLSIEWPTVFPTLKCANLGAQVATCAT